MQVLVSRKESDIRHRDEVIEESRRLLAPRRRFPPAAVAMGSSDMNEVVRVTTPHNDEVEKMLSDFLSCQDRSHDPSLLFISYSNFSVSMDNEFYKVHTSFGFITWDVSYCPNFWGGIGKDWNLSNFKPLYLLLYRIR
jgi:hypothetical protein